MSLVRNIGVLAVGHGVAQAIYFVGVVFLSRLYDPVEFGLYAVVQAIGMIAGTVASMRLEMTILLSRSRWQTKLATVTSVSVALVTLSMFSLVMAAAAGLTSAAWAEHWTAISIMALSYSLTNIFSFLQNKNKQYAAIVFIQIIRSTLFITFAFYLYFTPPGGNKLIAAASASSLAVIAANFFLDRSALVGWKRLLTFVPAWTSRHSQILAFSSLTVLISSLTSQTPVLLVAWLYGSGPAGVFSLAYRLVYQPAQIVSGAVNRVYLQSVSARIAANEPILPFTYGLLRAIVPLSILGTSAIFIASFYGLFGLVMGPSWQQVDLYILLLTPLLMGGFIARSIAGFEILGRNRTGLFFQVTFLAAGSSSFITSRAISSEVPLGILIYSMAMLAIYLLYIFVTLSTSRKIDELHSKPT